MVLDVTKEKIMDELLRLPEAIKASRTRLFEEEKIVEGLQEEMKYKEIEEYSKVCGLRGADGKSLYSNEDKRMNAVKTVLRNDADFTKMKESLRLHNGMKDSFKVTIEFDMNRFKAYEMIAPFFYDVKR